MIKSIRDTSGILKSSLPMVLLVASTASSALAYELIDLGVQVEPRAINNNGVIVGANNTDQYPSTAFFWSSDTGFELIPGATSANAVNDSGQIAGSTIDGAFILDGNYRDWSDSGAFGINQSGEVAGYSVGDNPYQPRSLPYNPAIFNGKKWQTFNIAKLYPRGTRQGVYADRYVLSGINDANGDNTHGYAVGNKSRYGLAGSAAILINQNAPVNDASDVVFLPIPYGGRATDINNSNMIVGTTGSSSSTGDYAQAFLYDYNGTALVKLGTLPSNGPDSEPGLTSSAYDINEMNQVVGTSWLVTANTSINDPAKYHAFLWEDGQMIDLNTVPIDQSGTVSWILTRATAVNDYGDIVGVGLVNGIEHGFLLSNGTTPAPPPVNNQAPVAVANADVTSGKAPLSVNFDSSGSFDADGRILKYSWNFMDGSSLSTDEYPLHTFTVADRYPVTLTVTDDQGSQASSIVTITVRKGKRN